MLRQELKHRLSINVLEGGLAGADAMLKFSPGPEMLFADHDRGRTHGARHVAAQVAGQRCQDESAVFLFREYFFARQGSQQSVERRSMRASGPGQLLGCLRSFRE